MIGRTIGRFRILAPLGQGGMASVWRARDEVLGREIALKILTDSLAQSEESRRRFRHEARIAAALDHPGIAAVHETDDTDGFTWIAMALIEGETLAERVSRSLVPVPQVVSIAAAVADALGYAHGQQVVHRDVTSRNVMLARDGRVFVLDFGLALAQGVSRISSSGTTVGTAPYMAPEMILGATPGAAADQYGLGVVMYEALTGSLPFSAARPAATVFAVLHESVRPPSDHRPEIPAALEAIVLRCLERRPEARFRDMAELAAALRAVEAGANAPEAGGAAAASGHAAGSPTAHSRPAERLASGTGVVYLALPPFELVESDSAVVRDTLPLARGMTAAAAAGLSRVQRLHVVPATAGPAATSAVALRSYARDLGAHLVVLGNLRRSGSRLRVTYAVHDPEAALQVAGDSIEGSALDPFELEDRLLASLRRALGHGTAAEAGARTRPPDPAAEERYRQALRELEHHDHEASIDGAIAILERLIESEGEQARYRAAIARACLFKYDQTKHRTWEARAAASAARAAELAPEEPETLLALADVHRVAGRIFDAEREYREALARRPDYFEARLGRARTLEALGHPDDAEAECAAAIADQPEDWRGHMLLGRIRFTRGRFDAAIGPWERAKQLAPNNALAARNLGSALFHLDRFDDALVELRRGLELRPDPATYTNLGTVLYYLGRYDEAASAFERGAALLPADPVKWGNLGNALRFTPGREAEARPALDRAIGLMRERLHRNPDDPEGWGRLAGWLVNIGDGDGAREAVARSLERGAEDVHCLVHAGHVFCQLGERDAALRHLNRAVELGYGPEGLARSPDLASLRDDAEFRELISPGPRPNPGGPSLRSDPDR